MLRYGGIDDRGQHLVAGQAFDVTEALALDLLKRGWAKPDAPAIEVAIARPPENAALRTSKPHRAK